MIKKKQKNLLPRISFPASCAKKHHQNCLLMCYFKSWDTLVQLVYFPFIFLFLLSFFWPVVYYYNFLFILFPSPLFPFLFLFASSIFLFSFLYFYYFSSFLSYIHFFLKRYCILEQTARIFWFRGFLFCGAGFGFFFSKPTTYECAMKDYGP